jgi:hypothetical protein
MKALQIRVNVGAKILDCEDVHNKIYGLLLGGQNFSKTAQIFYT